MANERPVTRRPGRPRAERPVLTRPAILEAALALVDEEGMEALSMRRLAARLRVDAMSIYHHLPNKAAIVSGLVEAVFATMPPTPADGPWPDRVRAWARAYRDLALAHPNLVLQIVTDSAAASEATILISEPLYAALEDAGLTAPQIVVAAGTLVDFVNGYALALSPPAADAGAPEADPMGQRLAALGPDQVPAIRRVQAGLGGQSPSGADYFDACLDIIIRGVTPP